MGINLGGVNEIPEPQRILFVGSELQARVRIEGVGSLAGRVDSHPVDRLPARLEAFSLAVIDLDEAGAAGAVALRAAGYGGPVLGFYSHVNEALEARAREAGIEIYPRGRFWRELEEILTRER